MDTSKLKKFAQFARRNLIDQVSNKLKLVLETDSAGRRENPQAVRKLEDQIKEHGREQVIEQIAYTWFNRFCALRFMDANRYTRVGLVSPAEGQIQIEILAEAKKGHIDENMISERTRRQVFALINGAEPSNDPQGEAYRLLLVAACNSYHRLMPFMFERIADFTELLIPDDLLSDNSILTQTREALTIEACKDVEVIGWLYQFYISEKKDDVFASLKKGKKITPENIPAATQLFTPHWIVRYLVENSLGRLWMLNHPGSQLINQMEYYIRPEEPETDFLRISNPEDIKICDPACGSGHMLTYAFDLLYAIYEEQGYQATDIPQLILTNNLYGIEIDQRAGALAAFALTMKAREKYRRFLSSGKVVQANICVLENIHIEKDTFSEYMDKVGRDLFTGGLQGVVHQFEEADNFGSLIRPLATDVSDVLELLHERQMGEDLFLAGVHQNVLKALRQADYLRPKYHVSVTNPPYMGGKNMAPDLKQMLGEKYPTSKADLMAAFMVRASELVKVGGYWSMINLPSWMFLPSFEKMRGELLDQQSILSLLQLGRGVFGSDFGSCAFAVRKSQPTFNEVATYRRLFERQVDVRTVEEIESLFLQAEYGRFCCPQSDFASIPGRPIAYWASEAIRKAFATMSPLRDIASPVQGMATTNNEMFLRIWFEVDLSNTDFNAKSEDDAEKRGKKWFPYNKGGEFRKWFGNCEYVVNFVNRGKTICDYIDNTPGAKVGSNGRVINREKYFQPAITWTSTSSGYFGVRYSDPGFIFDVKGSSCFAPPNLRFPILGFLASSLTTRMLAMLNPTIEFQNGNLKTLPIAESLMSTPIRDRLDETISECVAISRRDWNNQEFSWSFERNALVGSKTSLQETWRVFSEECARDVARLQHLETTNDEIINDAYSVIPSGKVPLRYITLNCNPYQRYSFDKSESELEILLLADTMREFISYAVGCMLGRYSLDKPGLILANQGETTVDYLQQIPDPTFAPDEDNVIPLLAGDWFTDDISERFKEFLKVTFGNGHFEENLTFLENALYPDNLISKNRKTIRDYFLKEFYKHHIKMYKKRPIYWLFSSPKGTFNALIYMHRYRPDTVSVILNDYLREFSTKLSVQKKQLEAISISTSASQSEKTKSLKEIEKLNKMIRELAEYERDVIYPLATDQVEIDLDDGVKVNYPKFGAALKKIPGVS